MIFRITQKLARKIKVVPVTALPPHDNPLLDWTANLFMVSRWQCILMTNSRSLYSVVLPGKGVPNELAFVEQSMKALVNCLMRDGIIGLYEAEIAPAIDSVSFCKAGDRRVLGSMNELIFQAKVDILHIGHPLQLVNYNLNRTLLSLLNGRHPIEALVALADR
ncbi:hypothetical protein GF348_12650 [candidate division KSB3 bacterium]|nr:hypothetical protein [candidate division KSB3 bacterium]